jgi:hypothetical protein
MFMGAFLSKASRGIMHAIAMDMFVNQFGFSRELKTPFSTHKYMYNNLFCLI